MKKLFLTLVVALASVAASAQVYVGGEVGLWRNYDANATSFTVQPEIGYCLDNNWALGISIGYYHTYQDGSKVNAVGVNPYVRYTFAQFGPVSLFCDGGFAFATSKPKGGDSFDSWQVGLKPGVNVTLNKRLSFVAHAGFLGWQDGEKGSTQNAFGDNGFGFNLSGNDLTFGLYYNF